MKDTEYELADKKDAIRVARGRIEVFEQQAQNLEREKVTRGNFLSLGFDIVVRTTDSLV